MILIKKSFLTISSKSTNKFNLFSISLLFLLPFLLNSFYSNDKAYIIESDNETCGIYCMTTLFLPDYFANKSFDTYFMQKSLHSYSANIIMTIFQIDPSPLNANRLLEIQSYILLVVMIPILISIKKILNFTILEYWVIYTFIILNSINIKYLSYNQESPDTTVIFFCLLAILIFLKNQFFLFFIITFLSSFIQPQLKLICYIFLVFFYAPKIKISLKLNLNEVLTKMILSMVFFVFVSIVFMKVLKDEAAVMYLSSYTIPMLLPISIIVSSIYLSLFIAYFIKLGMFHNIMKILSTRKVGMNIILVVVIELANFFFRINYAKGEPLSTASSLAGQGFTLLNFFYMSIQQPLKFFIPHAVMLGPIFVIIFILLVKNLQNDTVYFVDISIVLVTFFFFFSCINPETRHLAAFLPIIIVLLLIVSNFPRWLLMCLILCNLVFSRFYATMYTSQLNSDIYFLKLGPWYTTTEYAKSVLLTLCITIVSFIVLLKVTSKSNLCIQSSKKRV